MLRRTMEYTGSGAKSQSHVRMPPIGLADRQQQLDWKRFFCG
jgi:hypothetical protein